MIKVNTFMLHVSIIKILYMQGSWKVDSVQKSDFCTLNKSFKQQEINIITCPYQESFILYTLIQAFWNAPKHNCETNKWMHMWYSFIARVAKHRYLHPNTLSHGNLIPQLHIATYALQYSQAKLVHTYQRWHQNVWANTEMEVQFSYYSSEYHESVMTLETFH